VPGVLAVALEPASPAASLAQKLSRETGQVADIMLPGGITLAPGAWRNAWSTELSHPAPAAALLDRFLREQGHDVVLLDETPFGREVAGRLAARAKLGVIGQVVALRPSPGGLRLVRLAEAGARTAVIAPSAFPVIGVVSATVGGSGGGAGTATERQPLAMPPATVSPLELLSESRLHPAEMDLAEADVVVAGGRGVGGREGFGMLEELAGLLGGTVGASRVAVDAGWIPYARQVGLTGKTVAPRVYIACGISGAPHHVLGMRNSTVIVAINSDPQAPILRIAHVSLVGRVEEIVPRLIAEVRQRRSSVVPREGVGAR